MDKVVKAFQECCESGYVKTSTIAALDAKILKMDFHTDLEMGLRRDLQLNQVGPSVTEPETTFEIRRNPAVRNSTSQSSVLALPEPGPSAGNQANEAPADDLEARLNDILGQSYSF